MPTHSNFPLILFVFHFRPFISHDAASLAPPTTNKMSQHRLTHPRALTARLLDFLKSSSSVGLCAACTVLTTEKVWSELTDGCRAAAPHTGADHRQQPRPQRGSGSQVGEAARWSTLHTAPHCSIPPPADRWAQNASSARSANIQFFLPRIPEWRTLEIWFLWWTY